MQLIELDLLFQSLQDLIGCDVIRKVSQVLEGAHSEACVDQVLLLVCEFIQH
jgi:hypothetical protein